MSAPPRALRTRTRAALEAFVVVAFFGCAGCSSDSSDAGPEPATESSGATSAATATFGIGGLEPGEKVKGTSRTTLACRSPSHLLSFDQITVDREVELRSMEAVGTRVPSGRAWVTDDVDQASSSGLLALGIPGPDQTDQPGWSSREPLAGALLEPGTVYTYFVEYRLGRHGLKQGFRLHYAVDGSEAEVELPDRLSRRPCR